MEKNVLTTPLTEQQVRSLKLGDIVYLKGRIYTARDMAHLRIRETLREGKPLPHDFNGAALLHAGPVALQREDGTWELKAVGPTSSIRMEPYADMVGQMGIRAVIGKGGMEDGTVAACQKYGYVYLQGCPGCAAMHAKGINAIVGVDWIDLGVTEAMWDFDAECFGPLIVSIDAHGNSIYRDVIAEGQKRLDAMYPPAGKESV